VLQCVAVLMQYRPCHFRFVILADLQGMSSLSRKHTHACIHTYILTQIYTQTTHTYAFSYWLIYKVHALSLYHANTHWLTHCPSLSFSISLSLFLFLCFSLSVPLFGACTCVRARAYALSHTSSIVPSLPLSSLPSPSL